MVYFYTSYIKIIFNYKIGIKNLGFTKIYTILSFLGKGNLNYSRVLKSVNTNKY